MTTLSIQTDSEYSLDLNDLPISEKDQDLFGVYDFSLCLSNAFKNIRNPVGTTIALNGAWGAGKTSIINMIRKSLEDNQSDIAVSEFKCLWFRGEEVLAIAFLNHLTSILGKKFFEKGKDIARFVCNIKPIVKHLVNISTAGQFGSLAEDLISGASNLIGEKTLEDSFNDLSEQLRDCEKRFLIIIDDLDRLSIQEMLAIFRLLRTVGHLPNVMYLVAFDRKLAESSIKNEYPADGENFLDKIIQASFDIPFPSKLDLTNALLRKLRALHDENIEGEQYFRQILFNIILPYIETPRHIARFINIINITWSSIKDEINFSDFIAMESIRLYDSKLFSFIKKNKEHLFLSDEKFLQNLTDDYKLKINILFPQTSLAYPTNTDLNPTFNSQRRICVKKFFDTYLKLSISDEALAISEVEYFLNNLNNIEIIKFILLDAKDIIYRSKSTKSIAYLLELIYHTDKINKDLLESFLNMLFEIYNDIDSSCKSNEYFSMAPDAYFVYGEIIDKLFFQKTNKQENLDLYLKVMKNASANWLTRHLSYLKRKNETDNHHIDQLEEFTLQAIEKEKLDNTLIKNKNLTFILRTWQNLKGNNSSKILQWTTEQLSKNENLVYFIKSFCFPVLSLKDNISNISFRIDMLEDNLFNREKFHELLSTRKNDSTTTKEEKDLIEDFLSTWNQTNKQESLLQQH